ncbi:MAG: YitT family protein [Peptostreptococcaceae bacterium]|nr:YitT family protein [Peptostreptococcaceae bacterium]
MAKKSVYKVVLEYIGITLGCLLLAIALNFFLVPNTIAPGGISGLAVLINKLSGFTTSKIILIINIPLFIAGILVLGKNFGAKTAYGTIALIFILDILSRYYSNLSVTNDNLLSALYGGLILGTGLGIVFRCGGSTGGTDLIGSILNKYFKSLSIPKLTMIFDFFIVVFSGIVNKNIETALYSAIALYIIVRVADFIIEGLGYAKAYFIISNATDEIGNKIINDLGRGVTALSGRGMYTDSKREVMLVVINRGQEVKLKEIVKDVDPKAFVMVAGIHEVLGEGFKTI